MILPKDKVLMRSKGLLGICVAVTHCQRAGGRFPVEMVAQAVKD